MALEREQSSANTGERRESLFASGWIMLFKVLNFVGDIRRCAELIAFKLRKRRWERRAKQDDVSNGIYPHF